MTSEIKNVKAVIYARVSSKEQEEEGYSIPAQLKLLHDYATNNRLKIVNDFVDVETAKKAGRTNFNEMIEFMRGNGEVKVLICEKTDRLYRNFTDYVTIDDLDLAIHLVKEGEIISKESKSHQKFIHGIKVLMAKNYTDNLSEETTKGLMEKASQGIYPALAPIGYRNNTQTKTIEVNETKAPTVIKMFKLYATGKYSLQMIVNLINEEGLRGHKDRKLYKAHAEKILKNPLYYGEFRWQSKLFKGTHQPLITKELFDAVQGAFKSHNKQHVTRRQFAYSGLLTCGKCGCAMTAEMHKGKYTYYRCTGFKGKCGNAYIREEELSSKMSEVVKAIYVDDELLAKVKKSLLSSHKDEREYHDQQLQILSGQYTKLQNRIHQIYIDKLDGAVTDEFYKEKTAEWRREQDTIKATLGKHQNADTTYLAQGVHILELANKAYGLYLEQSFSEQATLLRCLLSNCTIIDATPYPTYRSPFDILAKRADRLNWGPFINLSEPILRGTLKIINFKNVLTSNAGSARPQATRARCNANLQPTASGLRPYAASLLKRS